MAVATMKKRGRKPVPKAERRIESIRVMLTAREKKALEQAASILGVATGDFVRSTAMPEAERIIAEHSDQ